MPFFFYSCLFYSPHGYLIWNSIFPYKSLLGGPSAIVSMISDKAGNIYTAGSNKITEVDKLSRVATYYRFLTTKLSNDGEVIWSESPFNAKDNTSRLSDLIVSDNENVYVTGTKKTEGVRTIKYVQCPSNANNARLSNISGNQSTSNETQQKENKTENFNPLIETEFVTMFPNPNDGNFYFNYSLPESTNGGEKCKFSVYDNIGKIVYEIEIKSGRNTVIINHDKFANGIYYYQVTSGHRLVKTERLVIAK